MCTLKYLHMKLNGSRVCFKLSEEKPKSWLKKVQLNIYLYIWKPWEQDAYGKLHWGYTVGSAWIVAVWFES